MAICDVLSPDTSFTFTGKSIKIMLRKPAYTAFLYANIPAFTYKQLLNLEVGEILF